MISLASFYPNFFHVAGIAYAALSIHEAMHMKQLDVLLMGIASGRDLNKPFYRNAIPHWAKPLAYKCLKEATIKRISERRFVQAVKSNAVVYLWPGTSLETFKTLKSRGHLIVVETVNTLLASSKQILDRECRRLNVRSTHGITNADVEEELIKLQLADYIFSCSPEVRKSLINAGIAEEKILDTSYGLRDSELAETVKPCRSDPEKPLTAIFVGSIGVRKGPHLLLDYWCRSGVKGRLRLIGDIDEEVRHLIAPYLDREDIEHIEYVDDLKPIYADADVFILPSLEEGSPLVTYLALGAGLPCLVSPMGAGGIVSHGETGLIMDPFDAEQWQQGLNQLFNDDALRERMGRQAHAAASHYLWSKVGARRAQQLLEKLK